jgi:DNA polymerase III epsilon subunit family exonuclease
MLSAGKEGVQVDWQDLVYPAGFALLLWIVFGRSGSHGPASRKARKAAPGQLPLAEAVPEQFIVFDLETTGLHPYQCEIIEIGAIRVNRDSDRHDMFQALLQPSKPIPPRITEITGITNEMVQAEGLPPQQALAEFKAFVGKLPMVAYNANFDRAFLRAAGEQHGVKITNRISCAMKEAQRAWPGLTSYKLADLAKRGNLDTTGTHRALKDCQLAMMIFIAAAREPRRTANRR